MEAVDRGEDTEGPRRTTAAAAAAPARLRAHGAIGQPGPPCAGARARPTWGVGSGYDLAIIKILGLYIYWPGCGQG